MQLCVGTKNETKLAAVRETVAMYPDVFPEAVVEGREVQIDLFGHPKSLAQTIEGAMDRARQAFVDCAFSFGIEGGLMEVPHTKTGYMEVGVCAVYDGEKIALGLSPAYEWPIEVTQLIASGQADGSQAFRAAGLTSHDKIGTTNGGAIGVLTDDRMTRFDFTRASIIMALIQLQHPHLYVHPS